MPTVTPSPEYAPPFAVEFVVLEEDRWLVLSAKTRVMREHRNADELIGDMAAATLPALGDVLIRGNRGLAVVHDFDESPSFRLPALDSAIRAVFAHCVERGFRSIAMEPLGAVHGPLTVDEFCSRLPDFDPGCVERIWLIVQDSG